MSRVVGFSLKLEGSTATIAEINKIEKALQGISEQINSTKKLNLGVLKPLFEGQEQLSKAISETNKVLSAQSKILSNLGTSKNVDSTIVDNLQKTVTKLRSEITKLQEELKDLKTPKVAVPTPEGFDKITAETKKIIEDIKKIAPAFDQLASGTAASFLNKITDIDIKLKAVKENITKAKQAGSTDNSENLTQLVAAEKALKIEKAKTVALLKEEEKQFIATSKAIDPTSVIGMREELSRLKAEYLKLSEAERNSAEGQKKFNAIVAQNNNISTIEQSLGDFRRNVGNYRDAVNGLVPTLLNLQKQGFAANQGLLDTFKNENRSKVDALEKEINQLSAAYAKLTAEERKADVGVELLNKLNTQADELNRSLRTLPNEVSGLKKSFIGIGDIITGGLVSGGVIAAVGAGFNKIRQAVDISAELSDIESDVRKTTGLTVEDVKKLESELKKIDTRTTTANLLKISAVAGQLGVEGAKGIEDFTKAINVVSVALGDDLGGDVDSISNNLAKLSNILFGSTTNGSELATNIQHIGNSLNVLASTSAATGDKIVEFASRIGRSLKPLGVTAEQILALSATFDELNILPEQGATAINNVIKDIGANINNFASVLDINKVELEKAFNTNPLNAFKLVLEKLNKLSGGNNAVLLEYLAKLKQTGEGVSSVILQLSSNTDLYDRNLQNATTSLKDVSSITSEYEIKNNNLAGSLDKLKKKFQDLASSEGIILLFTRISDFAGKLTDVLGPAIQRISLLLNSAFSGVSLKELNDVGASIERYFGKDVTDKFSKGKYLNEGFTLANRIVEIKKNNAELESEIDRANKIIINANAKIGQSTNELFIKAQEKIIENQKKIIQEKQSKIINPNQYANNFVQDVINPEELASVIETQKAEKKLTETELEEARKRLESKNKETEKKKKIHEDYLKSLEDLNKRLQELSINAIDNEFDQRIEKVRASTRQEIEKTKEKYKTQQALVKELIQKLGEAELNEITKINNERSKVLNEAVQELTILQKDVDVILNASVQADIEEKIKQFAFELSQQERTIQINYDTNLEDLKAQLANGLISTKDFEEQSKILDKKRLDSQLVSAQKYNDTVSGIYDDLLATQLLVVEATKEQAKYEAGIEATKKRVSIEQDLKSGKIDLGTADSLIVEQKLNTDAKLHQIEQKAIQDSNELERVNLKNKQDAADKVVALNKSAQEEITANELKEQDKRKENLQAVKDGAIELARITADAISQINQNQADRDYNRNIDNLEREKNARLKLVKGNTAEEERINREYDIKKRKLDEENFKRQQRAAILQATINGALGATAVFAVPDFTFGIKSAIQLGIILANTIAQIAIIKSQSFAEGGFAKKEFRRPGEGGMTGASIAPKDHTGKRPVGVATYHENEYTMPDWQVEMHEELAKAMDKDRATKSNYHVNLYYRKMAMKAIENYENNPGILRRKPEPRTIPFIYQPRHIQKESSKVEMSEEVIDRIAETIATKAEQAITKGVNKGYAQSVKEITQDELRKQQRELKKAM